MAPTPSLQFVVLRHEGVDEPHYDILFETAPGSLLSAWRSSAWPPAGEQEVVRLPDHRRIYLTYEGPISGNRGHVHRIASGQCHLPDHPSDRGSEWCVELEGASLPTGSLVFRAHPEGRWSAVLRGE